MSFRVHRGVRERVVDAVTDLSNGLAGRREPALLDESRCRLAVVVHGAHSLGQAGRAYPGRRKVNHRPVTSPRSGAASRDY